MKKTQGRGGHIKFERTVLIPLDPADLSTLEQRTQHITMSSTPSDVRADANSLADLRRMDVGVYEVRRPKLGALPAKLWSIGSHQPVTTWSVLLSAVVRRQ